MYRGLPGVAPARPPAGQRHRPRLPAQAVVVVVVVVVVAVVLLLLLVVVVVA